MPTPSPSPTHTPGALSVEAWPLVVSAKPGHSVSYTATVRDTGTKTIDVTTHTLVLHGTCSHLEFSPAHLTLKPGQEHNVTVTAPAGTATDYLAEFSGQVHGHGAGFNVAASVGSRLIVGKPASTTHACTAPKAVAPHPVGTSAGFPLWAVAAIAVAVLLAVVVVIRKIRKGRNTA